MSTIEKRPVKLIADFVKYVKNKASEDDFPYDNISKSLTIATSLFWKEWDRVKNDDEQREKFIQKVKKESEELEINGFLHHSRGTKTVIENTSVSKNESDVPLIDVSRLTSLNDKTTDELQQIYNRLIQIPKMTQKEYDIVLKIHEILTNRSKQQIMNN